MSGIETEIDRILSSFERAWTFDIRDLNRPSSDVILSRLIDEAPPELQDRLRAEFFDSGPLREVLTDSEVLEIVVNGLDEIWYERAGEFHALADRFFSELTFKNFVDRLCADSSVRIDLSQPFANGKWRDFRLHVARAPLTHCLFHLTFRRLRETPWTLAGLTDAGWCTSAEARDLRRLVHERQNVLVIGPTGSGKTSVLGAFLKELDPRERVVILEDTDELPRPNSASTKLLTRPEIGAALPEVTLSELVKQSLRMRPLRLAVGEVRGAEAKDLLLALATGHAGSFGTLHAANARQALLRLEMLIQMGAPQWNTLAIRQLIRMSLDVLVVCGIEKGQRRFLGAHRVAGLESSGFLLEPA